MELTPQRSRLVTAVAGFSCLVVALQQTLVVPAVPDFPRILDASVTAVSWIVTITLLTGAIATPIISSLSDIVGRRRMLLISMGLVFLGSVLSPIGTLPAIIIGRGLQGMGTALVPVAMAQMRDCLPPHRIGTALAILSATLGIGGGLGIPLGGFIISEIGWRALFWLSAGLSLLSIVAITLAISDSQVKTGRSFDRMGAVLLSIGLTALLLGIAQGNSWGWTSLITLSMFLLSVIVLVIWAIHQLNRPDPLVDLRTTISRPILMTNAGSLLMGIAMFTNLLVTTQQLQNPIAESGFEWSTTAAGLAMLPNAFAMFLVAPLTAYMSKRFSPHIILAVGAVITTAGYLIRLVPVNSGGWLVAWATLIGLGVGIGYAALPMLIATFALANQIGEANGVNALVRAVGTAISSAVVAAITATLAVNVDGATVGSTSAITAISTVGACAAALTLVAALLATPRQPQSLSADN